MRPSGAIATIAPRGARDSIEQLLGELLEIGIERQHGAAAVLERRDVVTVLELELVEVERDLRVDHCFADGRRAVERRDRFGRRLRGVRRGGVGSSGAPVIGAIGEGARAFAAAVSSGPAPRAHRTSRLLRAGTTGEQDQYVASHPGCSRICSQAQELCSRVRPDARAWLVVSIVASLRSCLAARARKGPTTPTTVRDAHRERPARQRAASPGAMA